MFLLYYYYLFFFAEREYYAFPDDYGDFQESRQFCRSKGMILSMPKTAGELEHLKAAVAKQVEGLFGRFWIGLKVLLSFTNIHTVRQIESCIYHLKVYR